MRAFSKETLQDIALAAIIILVGAGSFGLGRLSVKEGVMEPLQVLSPEGKERPSVARPNNISSQVTASAAQGIPSEAGSVVASKNSDKYHFSWCPGAKQISDKNKIVFASAQEAENAGYTKAANCK